MATELRNEAASIRLAALQLAQKEGYSGEDLASRAAYLADFIESGKEVADENHERRQGGGNAADLESGEVVEFAGSDWTDGPRIIAGSRLAFAAPDVPVGWRLLVRRGDLVIGEKL